MRQSPRTRDLEQHQLGKVSLRHRILTNYEPLQHSKVGLMQEPRMMMLFIEHHPPRKCKHSQKRQILVCSSSNKHWIVLSSIRTYQQFVKLYVLSQIQHYLARFLRHSKNARRSLASSSSTDIRAFQGGLATNQFPPPQHKCESAS